MVDIHQGNNKVAIFLSDLDGGGAERVMLNLAGGFSDNGFQVDLVLSNAVGPYLSQVPDGVNLINLDQRRLITSLFPLIKYLKKESPIAVLSALEDTNIVAVLAKCFSQVSSRLILTVHNDLLNEISNATNFKRRYVPYLIRYFYPFADAIVGVSQGVVNTLIALGSPAHKTNVIYNPIVTENLLKSMNEQPDHEWLTLKSHRVIIGVGRLTKQKDFSTLIRAFGLVKQELPVKLILLGEGEEREKLEQLVSKLDLDEDVFMPGFIENPYGMIAHSDLLVMSSAWEGFGNVLVEALAAGKPVVSTNCESGPSEILSNGKYGKLVTVGDVRMLANCMIESLDNPLNPEFLVQRSQDFSLEAALLSYKKLMI